MLQGEAFSQESVHEYVNLLAFSDHFEGPKLMHIQKKEGDRAVFTFGISCPLAAGSERKK